jgi:hypothetical protein
MKLKWQHIGPNFDLALKNPESVNITSLHKLLKNVEESSANWRKDMHFNTRASEAFIDWLGAPSMPLPGYAYALLSNWFLTGLKFVRESPRGNAALEMWNNLFCAIPERRLTDPKRNDKIILHEFDLWWPKQQECQEDC